MVGDISIFQAWIKESETTFPYMAKDKFFWGNSIFQSTFFEEEFNSTWTLNC